jgi:DNA-binding transcriptional MerR regulator
MPETQSATGGKLYTLSEISKKSGISMPTLQRYKKLYQGRIPAVGKGRKQRYPEESLPVFEQIKQENIGRRGRPRKNAAPPRSLLMARRGRPRKAMAARGAVSRAPVAPPPARGRRRAAAAPQRRAGANLLTLTSIQKETGISYPTLVRYVRLHLDRLPHEGRGRARRFYPQAVAAFRQLREESPRGGRRKAMPAAARRLGRAGGAEATGPAVGERLRGIEKRQTELERKLRVLVRSLQNLLD